MKISRGLLAVVMVGFAVPVCAQSLGDLAKKEAERRKAMPPAQKVYTDDDLKKIAVPGGAAPVADATAKPADPSARTDAPADAAKPDADKADKADKDKASGGEAEWRAKMTNAREGLRRSEAFAEALQSQINGLTADFTARDDPYQRAKIADDRQKALADLEQAKRDIESGKKAIAAIEEEARRANVPPGWIR